jgi:myo-inositol-1(or 4)-monophosphatase
MTSPLLDLVRSITLEAADFAAERRREGVSVVATKSSAVDVVTQVDRDTEALIRRRIREVRPDDGFFGEESGAEPGSSGLNWIVDPIDGTVNFLYGIPHWCVSVAVVEGEPDPLSWNALAGCIVNPSAGEIYTATDGGGAFLGDSPLRVGSAPSLDHALVATGFYYDADDRAHQGAVVARLLPLVRDIRRLGSGALDLCAVATGRVDAYFESHLSPWDHAAAALVAREAGAVVTGGAGRPTDARLTLAGPAELIVQLEALLVEHGY